MTFTYFVAASMGIPSHHPMSVHDESTFVALENAAVAPGTPEDLGSMDEVNT